MVEFERIDYVDFSRKLISLRRDFHKYAEPAWTEYRTTVKIIEELEKLGIQTIYGPSIHSTDNMPGKPSDDKDKLCIERAIRETGREDLISSMAEGYTGVVGIIEGHKPGPIIALRFEIDSNDLIESEDNDHVPYKEGFSSVHYGAMHGCAHDGHTAIGLGTAEILTKYIDKLCGKVIFIFQAAEEGGRGAKSYIAKGILENVDYILSAHIGLKAKELGLVSASTTGFLASTKFDVEYIGKSAHAGASPEEGYNALAAAASATLNLLAISRHSQGSSRINIGVLESGTGRNVIPDFARMKVETRGMSEEINSYIYDRAIKICTKTAMMYDCKCEIKYMGGTTSTQCDPELIDIVEKSLQKIDGVNNIVREIDFGAGEDFTYMMNEVRNNGGKATYLMLGADLTDAHHGSKFNFSEEVLVLGAKSFAMIVLDIGNNS